MADYDGTLLVVSHDRYFLDAIVTSTLVFEDDGQVRRHAGGYSDWLDAPSRARRRRRAGGSRPRQSSRDTRERPAQRKLSYKLQRELDALPDLIARARAESRRAARRRERARASTSGRMARCSSRSTSCTTRSAKLEAAVDRWAELEQQAAAVAGERRELVVALRSCEKVEIRRYAHAAVAAEIAGALHDAAAEPVDERVERGLEPPLAVAGLPAQARAAAPASPPRRDRRPRARRGGTGRPRRSRRATTSLARTARRRRPWARRARRCRVSTRKSVRLELDAHAVARSASIGAAAARRCPRRAAIAPRSRARAPTSTFNVRSEPTLLRAPRPDDLARVDRRWRARRSAVPAHRRTARASRGSHAATCPIVSNPNASQPLRRLRPRAPQARHRQRRQPRRASSAAARS